VEPDGLTNLAALGATLIHKIGKVHEYEKCRIGMSCLLESYGKSYSFDCNKEFSMRYVIICFSYEFRNDKIPIGLVPMVFDLIN
jgi:hypothetical protein